MHQFSKAEMHRPVIPPGAAPAMTARRLGFAAANLLIYAAFLAALSHALGSSWLRPILVACTAAFLPWYVLGLTNGAIGLCRLSRRPSPPPWADAPITAHTTIVMTVRNEDPARAIARLRIVADSIAATNTATAGAGDTFGYVLLSDTDNPDIAAQEEALMDAWRREAPHPDRIRYRRRADNAGFKAGNIMDFCRNHAAGSELMVILDADSLMSGPAILHLVRMMQAHPRIGIVQSLVTGLPSPSPFARLFQFGMRHGMRSYTVGQAWWTGDCGPFWGHNAIIRIAPFRKHCALPVLPGKPPLGGPILSHDQVEAALMRRAGWEVRLQPVAGGSWEDNPPTLIDYIFRDLRWCQGNLQYLRLLRLPGLYPVSRFQLLWAILMFIGLPAFALLIALLPLAGATLRPAHPVWLATLYGLFVLMDVFPKLAGYLSTAASPRRLARYGGPLCFLAGIAAETVFAWLKYAITALHTTAFMAALCRGRGAAWTAQRRDAAGVSWTEAARMFWPHTAFGVALHGALLAVAPLLLPWALPYTLGPLLAIPFAVLTADRRIGAWCVRHGLCATPEERSPPPEVARLKSE